MELYDEFSCNLDEAEKPVAPVPPLHGNISDKEAVSRLKHSQVGSYLIRISYNSRSGKFHYMISYAVISSTGGLQVMHRGLDIGIGSEEKIPELLKKLDPGGNQYVNPLYPDARIRKIKRQSKRISSKT